MARVWMRCPSCGKRFVGNLGGYGQGRPGRYCSVNCRMRAYRARKRAAAREAGTP